MKQKRTMVSNNQNLTKNKNNNIGKNKNTCKNN